MIPQVSSYGAYLHIPFCRRRCFYCDFSIEVIGDRTSTIEKESQAYTSLLVKEIKKTSKIKNSHDKLETIYFGGGTPSLLPSNQVYTLLTTLDQEIGIASDAEVTFEMDPATFDSNKMKEIKSVGVNRVSLGVQSFNNKILEKSGRAHRLNDVYRALEDVTSSKNNFVSIHHMCLTGCMYAHMYIRMFS